MGIKKSRWLKVAPCCCIVNDDENWINEPSSDLHRKHKGVKNCPEMGGFKPFKCGEETSPTPQMDWSLAHGLKAAFDLNLLKHLSSFFRNDLRPCL